MKKKIRILSLCFVLLAVVTVFAVTPFAFAEGEGSSRVTVTDASGTPVTDVALPQGEKITLTAHADGKGDVQYQWQILADADRDLWVNISGEQDKTIEISYAMVCSVLKDDQTAFRCVAAGEETAAGNAVNVTVIKPQTAAPAVKASAAKANTAAAEENNENTGDICYVDIKYVFEGGEEAASPWTATVAKGTTLSQVVASPEVVGYTPDKESVDLSKYGAFESNKTIYVTYQPADVGYTVKYYQQKVDSDEYEWIETELKEGLTGKRVSSDLGKEKNYEGFYALLYDDTATIAADGTTEVEVYFDRYYYLMTFDLDGGYGVEPIYARYGAPVSVADPTKPGYTFDSWDKELPATMPAENTTYKAKWIAGTSGFTVVFWYENADDNNYSVVGTYTPANVAPGTEKKSDDYKNQSFTGRDDTHFTYNAEKAETVTVAGDGSTVLNVYFTRNTYTLTFRDRDAGTEQVLTCGKEVHTHTYEGRYYNYKRGYYYGGCYPAGGNNSGGATRGNEICGKEEHTHNEGGLFTTSCYSEEPKVVATITAKYGAKVSDEFGKAPFNTTYNGRAWKCTESGKYNYALQTLDRMPGFDAAFDLYNKSSNTKKTIYYYVQKVGTTVNANQWPANANSFDLLKQVDTYFNYATYDEEYHEILGFTRYSARVAYFDDNKKNFSDNRLNLYYMRNSYDLKFYNYNGYVDGKGGSVQYEAPLKSHDFTPGYPEGLEENAYVFGGWYTSAGCYAGSEADLNNMTMPASNLILYAKWVPKTHTVKTFLTKDAAAEEGSNPLNTWENVPHGKTVEKQPNDPVNGQYKFVGWFYEEDGTEKAFDFSMPVNKDLNLYAKWSSDVLVNYTIRYVLEDGTVIGTETTGSALAQSTKTFEAKTGTNLMEGYQSGYFPKVSSHSLTMEMEGGNEFDFVYVQKEKVDYTVRYLEKGTNKVLAEEVKKSTPNAVVTERFEAIQGYVPDAVQKRLVLSADGENVLTFWYEKDEAHAPVQIFHLIQTIDGSGYMEYQKKEILKGDIGQPYTENPLTIPGFEYNEHPEQPLTGYESKASGTLTAEGLTLSLYYDRISYPYEFRFLEQGTNKELADPEKGSAPYEKQVTQDAKFIPGYTRVGAESQAIRIGVENPANVAEKNVKTFYYTENVVTIAYVSVTPDMGSVDSVADNAVKVLNGTPAGSTPTAKDGFKFVGWYKDADCTEAVDSSWVNANNKIVPQKSEVLGKDKDGKDILGYKAATYYAKFEPDVADLTITKTGAENIDEHQSFVFEVKQGDRVITEVTIKGNGSAVVKNLKVGSYTVTEKQNWSWRYEPNTDSETVEVGVDGGKVTFANSRIKTKWLNGCNSEDNKWSLTRD